MARAAQKRAVFPGIGRQRRPLRAGLALAVALWASAAGRDLLRPGISGDGTASAATAPAAGPTVVPATALVSSQDRLARTTLAVQAVQQMQAAARQLAVAGPNNLRANLPTVPVNSYQQANGLVPANGVPKNLSSPAAGEDATLWTGANLPQVTTQTSGSATATTVTITQTQQQAVLNWQSFNIGKNTSLVFDQSLGGADIGQWIAFNKIGVTGTPSQVLGSIKADGQVYVINPNGIIFGGSSQVNTHALVASSLPINDNLVSRGLLNNPDAQFLFSAQAIASGPNGTPAFTPVVTDPVLVGGAAGSYTLAWKVATGTAPTVTYAVGGAGPVGLTAGKDFLVGSPDAGGKTTLTFPSTGRQKITGAAVTVTYAPAGDQYGDVTINAGAQLTAPTSTDHIGGRIALVGPNVTNAGTLSTADGQTILAAGLQVGFAAHASTDPSLRGLDVYVGAVGDAASTGTPTAGTVTNGDLGSLDTGTRAAVSTATTNPPGTGALGLILAARGDVYLTGRTVNQLGVVDSSTSVAYNGRIDLVASYGAVSARGQANAPPYFLLNTGTVELGAGSVTRILPEWSSTNTVVGSTLALHSQIVVQGQKIQFDGSTIQDPGAILLAPNASVSIDAGTWQFNLGGLDPVTGFPQGTAQQQFTYNSGQILVGTGAAVDVAGSQDISAPVSENIVAVQLRGPELANSPLQRDGLLRGQTIQVDVRQNGTYNGLPWVGTPLADTSGYIGLIPHTVGELTTDGGAVRMSAGNLVQLQAGSVVDVSGGWIDYLGGPIQTTKLLFNGHVIDISQATPDNVYSGIYDGTATATDAKWGTTQTSTNPITLSTYSPGYSQGGSGGSLAITAAAMKLDGTLAGKTSPGNLQRAAFIPYASNALAAVTAAGIDPRVWELGSQPQVAALSLTFEKQYRPAGATAGSFQWYSPTPPDISIQAPGTAVPTGTNVLVLSSNLVNPDLADSGGFGFLTIDNSADNYQLDLTGALAVPVDGNTGLATKRSGTITVAADAADANNVTLRTAPGGAITLDAGNIVINGGVVAPGGQLKFAAHSFWPRSTYNFGNNGVPAYDPTRGNLTLAAGAILNASGLVVDDRIFSGTAGTQAMTTQGGAIALSGSNVALAPTSLLEVNGGALLGATGNVTYGAAGSIALKAGADPVFAPILGGAINLPVSAQTTLAADHEPLQAFSGGKGGALTIGAPLIQVGASAPGVTPPTGTLVLSPDFFSAGGFSTFALQGVGRAMTDANGKPTADASGNPLFYPAVAVTPGTIVHPRVQPLLVAAGAANFIESVYAAPDYLPTPVSLILTGSGAVDPAQQGLGALRARGDVVVGLGAALVSDAGNSAALTLSGQTITVLGSLIAPGGTISVSGGRDSTALFADTSHALPTVDLGPQSQLLAGGTTILAADPNGLVPGATGYLRTGSVLAGGTIAVSGNLVAEAGARLDVSGWSDTKDAGGLLNLLPALSAATTGSGLALAQGLVPTVVDSNAGKITLTGRQELVVDATLVGEAGGSTAAGGTLAVASGVFIAQTPLDVTLQVTASGTTAAKPFYTSGQTAIGHAVLDKNGAPVAGMGYFEADRFASGGFDALTLGGAVSFKGTVNLAATRSLAVGDSGLIFAAGAVNLSAPYVALGQPYLAPELPTQVVAPFIFGGAEAHFAASYGTGILTVAAGSAAAAGLIDIGNLSLQGVGQTGLVAVGGDVRGYGTFDLAGSLAITAGVIYPTSATTFNIAASDYRLAADAAGSAAHPGSVTLIASADRPVPLSAGGTLGVHASVINQGGVVRAPFGTINLGWDGSRVAPIDPITGAAFAPTQSLTLAPGGLTSVSAAGAVTPIPYGLDLNGTTWVDPSGADITSGGLPAKSINLDAGQINVAVGTTIDTSGGGDLYAFQFIPGTGGTSDLLAASVNSFAVIPSYQAFYAPDARFNSATSGTVTNLAAGDPGYASIDAAGNSRLAVGDQVHLDLHNGMGAEDYTLLPARYALLPGAYLVTPQSSTATLPAQAVARPDGSLLVTGYRFNAFDRTTPLYTAFEVATATRPAGDSTLTTPTVVRSRAQFADYSANVFFGTTDGATAAGQRLPRDAGQLAIISLAGLGFQGAVNATPAANGRSGLIDISSPEDIVINNSGQGTGANTVYLSSSELSNIGAGSLLVGGTRSTGTDGTVVNVTAANLTVDNAGGALSGPDVILVANENLTLADGASVQSSGTVAGAIDSVTVRDTTQLSNAAGRNTMTVSRGGTPIVFPSGTPAGESIKASVAGTITLADGSTASLAANVATKLAAGSSVTLNGAGTITAVFSAKGDPITLALGDGALVRVSSDPAAQTVRLGVVSSTRPSLRIGKGVVVKGGSLILDSSNSTSLDATTVLQGTAVSLNSGRISLQLAGATGNPQGLVLSGSTLATIQATAQSLSLLSYSTIDTFGSGQVGQLDSAGRPTLTNLSLHAAAIRGDGGDVTFNAGSIALDNSPGGTAPLVTAATSGTLTLNADTVSHGGTVVLGTQLASDAAHDTLNNQIGIGGYRQVALLASGGVLARGAGGLNAGLGVAGDLTIRTPAIVGAAAANLTISASGDLKVQAASGSPATTLTPGLGATVQLVGKTASLAAGTTVTAPAGKVSVHATGGDVTIGGTLDASGTSQAFNDVVKYVDAGEVRVTSDTGNVELNSGSAIRVAALAGGGAAGSVDIAAPVGQLLIAGGGPTPGAVLDAAHGQGGNFSLDAASLSAADGSVTSSLSALEQALAAGGFTAAQTVRVRQGSVVVDGAVRAHQFELSADAGSVTVTKDGAIDASGQTGGRIDLVGGDAVNLESGASLSVRAVNFDAAGRGGEVALEAGSSDTANPALPTSTRGADGLFADGRAVVNLATGSSIDLSVINDRALELNAGGSAVTVPTANVAVYFPAGTPGNDQVALGTSGTVTTATGATTMFAASAAKPYVTSLAPGSTVALGAAGTITFASGSGGSIPVSVATLQADGNPLNVNGVNITSLAPYNHTGTLVLRAPQVPDGSGWPLDVRVDPMAGDITGASSVVVEGFRNFDLSHTATPGLIDYSVQEAVQNNGAELAGGVLLADDGTLVTDSNGNPQLVAGHTDAILTAILGSGTPLRAVAHLQPGAEIVNLAGDLTLASTWDFAAGASYLGGDPALAANWDRTAMPYRFGPDLSEPGFLRLRAKGNLTLAFDPAQRTMGSLSDGFGGFDGFDNSALWEAVMLPAGSRSWSFQLVAGADFSAAAGQTVAATRTAGSVVLGLNAPALPLRATGSTPQAIVPDNFETVRTGTGTLGIFAAGDVRLLNNLVTIYTAGTQTAPLNNFDLPNSEYPAQFTEDGGNVTIVAGGNIAHLTANGAADSSRELPVNWLDRRGWIDPLTGQFAAPTGRSVIDSTAWWIDFTNFFEGVGALGGGNVTLVAGHDITNVDAVVPTNARTTRQTAIVDATGNVVADRKAADQTVLELGGGNLTVRAGHDIDGGVYYVERGQGELSAGNNIHTNSTRAALAQTQTTNSPKVVSNPASWLPTTLFLGNGSFTVTANRDLLLGPVANPFLLPQAYVNGFFEKTYFSTYAASDAVTVTSLNGNVSLKDHPDSVGLGNGGTGSLTDWFNRVLAYGAPSDGTFAYQSQPWLRIVETDLTPFTTLTGLMPASLAATAFRGDIDLMGGLTLSPAANGQVELAANQAVNGLQPNGVDLGTGLTQWGTASINLSDADPGRIPGLLQPLALSTPATGSQSTLWLTTSPTLFTNLNGLFAESASTTGTYGVIQTKQALHAAGPLHAADADPVHLYATTGDISGLTMYAGKSARVVAGRDVTDVALYLQNNQPADITAVVAGRNLVSYNPISTLHNLVLARGDEFLDPKSTPLPNKGSPTAGDIQVGGPGTVEVLAGGNLSLGVGTGAADGTSVGLTTIGNTRNPSLAFAGADIVAIAGMGAAGKLSSSAVNFTSFVAQFLDPATAGQNAVRHVPELAEFLGLAVAAGATTEQVWAQIVATSAGNDQLARLALEAFFLVLRDAGRDRNNPESPSFRGYTAGYQAIKALFPGSASDTSARTGAWTGDLSLATRLIETTNGGNITLVAPGGNITVGRATDPQKPDQGLLTAHGGDIAMFASGNVNVGTSRIFTLRGGNEIIWSTTGNIAAGSGSKTVKAAPPTRVLIDPQSGNLKNDLAGLATGSGIGVLATLAGVPAGDVDLIAPVGTVDAGDAGIRSSGNLNIAAQVVLNSSNIQVGGTSAGSPPPPPAPNLGSLTAASSASAGASSAAADVAKQNSAAAAPTILPSIISVEVLGYGEGDGDDDDDKKDERRNGAEAVAPAPPGAS